MTGVVAHHSSLQGSRSTRVFRGKSATPSQQLSQKRLSHLEACFKAHKLAQRSRVATWAAANPARLGKDGVARLLTEVVEPPSLTAVAACWSAAQRRARKQAPAGKDSEAREPTSTEARKQASDKDSEVREPTLTEDGGETSRAEDDEYSEVEEEYFIADVAALCRIVETYRGLIDQRQRQRFGNLLRRFRLEPGTFLSTEVERVNEFLTAVLLETAAATAKPAQRQPPDESSPTTPRTFKLEAIRSAHEKGIISKRSMVKKWEAVTGMPPPKSCLVPSPREQQEESDYEERQSPAAHVVEVVYEVTDGDAIFVMELCDLDRREGDDTHLAKTVLDKALAIWLQIVSEEYGDYIPFGGVVPAASSEKRGWADSVRSLGISSRERSRRRRSQISSEKNTKPPSTVCALM